MRGLRQRVPLARSARRVGAPASSLGTIASRPLGVGRQSFIESTNGSIESFEARALRPHLPPHRDGCMKSKGRGDCADDKRLASTIQLDRRVSDRASGYLYGRKAYTPPRRGSADPTPHKATL